MELSKGGKKLRLIVSFLGKYNAYCCKMAKHTLKILTVFTPQDFYSMFGHFTTLCIKGLNLTVKLFQDPTPLFLNTCSKSAIKAQEEHAWIL